PEPCPPPPPGRASPRTTSSTAPPADPSDSATAAVPSELPSSTNTTENSPRYSCPNRLGKVSGSIPASSRAGITATTEGQAPAIPLAPPSPTPSLHPVRQYPPSPTHKESQATAPTQHATPRNTNPPPAR